jgi:hypothetical protein
MNDRERAEELLGEAWQRRPAHELERVEILLAALVHAVLASGETPVRPLAEAARGQWDGPELFDHASTAGRSRAGDLLGTSAA